MWATRWPLYLLWHRPVYLEVEIVHGGHHLCGAAHRVALGEVENVHRAVETLVGVAQQRTRGGQRPRAFRYALAALLVSREWSVVSSSAPTTHYSVLTSYHFSLLTAHYVLRTLVAYCLLLTAYCLLPTAYSLLTTHHVPWSRSPL